MSLINEALQRARDEAARRQAASRGVPLPPVTHARPRSPWMMVTVVFLAGALTVTLLLLAGLAFQRRDPGPQTTAAITQIDATPVLTPPVHASQPTATASKLPEVRKEELGPAPSPEAVQEQSLPVPMTASPTRHTVSSADREGVYAAAIEVETAPEPEAPGVEVQQPTRPQATPGEATVTAASSSAPPVDRQIFVRRAVLDGDDSIDLGGIAWSGTGPFALLNGKVLGVGEALLGFELVEINPNEVVLQRDLETIILRLK